MIFDPELERTFAVVVALQQGDVMLKAFVQGTNHETKEDGTEVTEADRTISRNVVGVYAQRGMGVVSEEGGNVPYGTDDAAIVDPIDGTSDYIEGQQREPRISQAMFSLAITRRLIPVVGVTYAPLLTTSRLYSATRDGLAIRHNPAGRDVSLQVDDTARSGVVLVSGGSWGTRIGLRLSRMGLKPLAMTSSVFKATAVADPDLIRAYDDTLLEPGDKVVGFVSTGTHAHDHAASGVIVRAAGGIVTSLTNGPLSMEQGRQGCIMSVNRRIHEKLLEATRV